MQTIIRNKDKEKVFSPVWKSYYLWLVFIICLVVAGAAYSREGAALNDNRPNIVFIMVDDLGWGELGSYGNTFNETPNLDRLASESKRFTNAYAAGPVCSPTRASIMTGQYPARVGITDFLPGGWRTDRFLDPTAYTTLNEALTEKGYHTGIVGKWHLDTRFNIHTGSPVAHGFHEVIGSETKYISGGDYFFPYDKIETYTEGSPNEYLTDRQNQDACNFIQRNKNKSFFLYLSYYSVHTRLEAPQHTVTKYKQKFDQKYGVGSADRLFEANQWHEANHLDNPYLAAMLEHIDNGVGMIMQTLEDNGLADNTLIVFTSDNGGAHRVANNGQLRSYKTWLYEGGIRVPLLVHWPNQIQSGEAKEAVSSIDFYPTLVSAAGGNVSQYSIDGENLLPLLQGGQDLKDRNLYWHYPSETGQWSERMATAIRQGDYKLIRFYADDRYELYNLADDPSEITNLASGEVEKVRELSVLMENWKQEVNAEEPKPLRTSDFYQNFDDGGAYTDYIEETGTATLNNKFVGITTQANVTASIEGDRLRFTRSNSTVDNMASWTIGGATSPLSPIPEVAKVSMEYTVSENEGYPNQRAYLVIGENFASNAFPPVNGNIHSSFSIRCTNNAGEFYVNNGSNQTPQKGTEAGPYSGTVMFTWIINNSGTTCTYIAPDGSFAQLANDKWDLYIGNGLVLNAQDAINGTKNMGAVKFAFGNTDSGGSVSGKITVDMDDISAIALPVTLPVSLTSFTGTNQGNHIKLNWNTVSERSNSHFEVLRSADGKTFKTIGTVQGNGTSNQQQNYSYIDSSPLTGLNYYRLIQVDFDGSITEYPEIVSVQSSVKSDEFKVFVTAGNQIKLSVYAVDSIIGDLLISDILGRKVYSRRISLEKGNNTVSVSGVKLPDGLFIANLMMGGEYHSAKFVK